MAIQIQKDQKIGQQKKEFAYYNFQVRRDKKNSMTGSKNTIAVDKAMSC